MSPSRHSRTRGAWWADLKDVIRECCEVGDVAGFIEDLEAELIADL